MKVATALRWIAHVWGVASFLLILAFVAGGAESMRPTTSEAVGLLLFPLGVLLGFGIAWWHEGVGGLVTLGSLALFYLWMFGRDGKLPTGPYFVLLALPGFLHTASAYLFCSPKSGPNHGGPSVTSAG